MKQGLEEVESLSSSSSSSSIQDSTESESSESEIEGDKLRRSVKGIVVKHLENVPFSSTLCAFLNLHEISAPLSSKDSRKFRRFMAAEVKSLSIHLCGTFGLFEWEKETLGIAGGISSGDYRIRSSFTPTYDLHKNLKCLLHLQIKLKLKRFEREVKAMQVVLLGNALPTKEIILRKNLLLDLAMLLQHQVKVSILKLQQEKHVRVGPELVDSTLVHTPRSPLLGDVERDQVVVQDLQGWKSLLTVRNVSFEERGDGLLHSCVILPFDGSRKGFVIFRKDQDQLIPLLWAKPKLGLKQSGFDVYEANGEKNLLGIVRLGPFGTDGKVYERFKYGDVEFLKEIAAINYHRNVLRPKKKTGLDFTILLRHWENLQVKEDESCVTGSGSKSMSLRSKWKEAGGSSPSADAQIDFHVLKIRKPGRLDESGEKTRGKIHMEVVHDESGDIFLRMRKLEGSKYSLEYKRPFDAFTAFSSALSRL